MRYDNLESCQITYEVSFHDKRPQESRKNTQIPSSRMISDNEPFILLDNFYIPSLFKIITFKVQGGCVCVRKQHSLNIYNKTTTRMYTQNN